MADLEIVPRSQAASTSAQPAAGKSIGVGVKPQPKMPAGIADVATRPQDPLPWRPMAAPVGGEPLVAARTLQFGEAAGPQSPGGSGANSAAPSCSLAEASVNAKEAVVSEALKERDPVRSLQILNRGYAAASPDVRKLIAEDDITRFVVAEAVKNATVALTDQTVVVIDKHDRRAAPQGRADHVIEQIHQLVRGFDKGFAGIVVNEAMPVFRGFYQSSQSQPYSRLPDGSLLGYDGVAALASLADQIAGSPEGDAAISDFATMKAWHGEAMLDALASGTGRAYAAAYGHLMETKTGDSTFVRRSLAASSMAQLGRLRGFAADHGDALGEHGAQMARIADDFALFPADRYKKAMDAYRASMDAGWQHKETALEHTIVEDGKYLLRHLTALNKIAEETGLTDEWQAEWEAIANDPKASNAINAALEKDSDLVEDDGLKQVAGLLETLRKEPGPTGKLAFLTLRMTSVAANAFLLGTVLKKLNAIKPGDPAGAVKITEALAGLRNPWFARMLGLKLSEADLNRAVEIVTKASVKYADNAALLAAGTTTPEELAALSAKVAKLNAAASKEFYEEIDKFGTRVAAFNRATLAGQMMRGLVVSVAVGLNFVASLDATIDHPDGVRIVRTVDLGLLGAQRTSDLLVSLGVDPNSAIGRYAAAKLGDVPGIGRLVGANLASVPIGEVYLMIYAVLEAVNAARSAFGWGVPKDTVQASLSAVSAVGFGLAFARAYRAAKWTGPWGILIAAAAARGQMMYDGSKAAHQDEEKIKICLKAAGVESDHRARVLSRQMGYRSSVPGHSQLRLVSEYALSRNLDVVDWINSMESDVQVDRLSNVAKMELNNGQENPSQYRPQPVSPDVLASDEADTMNEFERQLILHRVIGYKPILPGQAKP
jgi:hypothetical protein